MSSDKTSCATRDYQNTTNETTEHCLNCDEGFCQNCGSYHAILKAARHHRVSDIECITPMPDQKVPTCHRHGQNTTSFCPIHDEEICAECISSDHKKCTGVLSIEDAAQSIKSSTRLTNLEDEVTVMIANTDKCLEKTQHIGTTLDTDRLRILVKIKEVKRKKLAHLDRIESASVKDLDLKYHEAKSLIEKSKTELEGKSKTLKEIHECLSLVKSASSQQLFRSLKQLRKKLEEEKKTNLSKYVTGISVTMDRFDLSSVEDQQHNFGIIKIEKKMFHESGQVLANKKQGPVRPNRLNVNARLLQRFDLANSQNKTPKVGNCRIFSEGNYLILDHRYRRFVIQNAKGNYKEAKYDSFPCDVQMLDKTRFAISFFEGNINLYDNISYKLIRKVLTGFWGSNGLSYDNGYLYVACGDSTIRKIHADEPNFNTVEKIPVYSESPVYRLSVADGNIYYHDQTILYCSDIKGKLLWIFKHDDFKELDDIVFDGNDRLYVCDVSTGVYVVSSDGKKSKCLIEKAKGVCPKHIHYSSETKQILVSLDGSKQFGLYEVL